ncbi:MAG: hypothetical protein K6F32_00300, partial [Bacilli bacterium]|nr:hypothetical protein [Bacilli bacterium]
KKGLLILASASLTLAGCSSVMANLDAEPAYLQAGDTNTIYLVLSKIGQYSGTQPVKETIEDKFLENAIVYTAEVGSALPGSDEITATSGAEFQSWVSYDGTGALTEYTTVPSESGKILYAYFGNNGSGTSETSGGQTSTSSYLDEPCTYTITGIPEWITNDGCVIFAWVWGNGENGAWVDCVYGDGDTPTYLTFDVDHEMTGCLLARCAEGTTEPNWKTTGSAAGRVFNQTENITLTSGTYSYACATWKEYSPS